MKVDLPEDVIRMARLAARLGGEELEDWLGNLVRHHVDTAPLPEWPLVIEQLTEAAANPALEPAKTTAEPPEPSTQDDPPAPAKPASKPAPKADLKAATKAGPKAAPKAAPKPEPEDVDDTTLVLRTAQEAGLLDSDHVIAVVLRKTMHDKHDWFDSTQGSRRIAEALRRVGVQKLASGVPAADDPAKRLTAYPTAAMLRALARRRKS